MHPDRHEEAKDTGHKPAGNETSLFLLKRKYFWFSVFPHCNSDNLPNFLNTG